MREANSLALSELLGLAPFKNRVQLHIAYYSVFIYFNLSHSLPLKGMHFGLTEMQ